MTATRDAPAAAVKTSAADDAKTLSDDEPTTDKKAPALPTVVPAGVASLAPTQVVAATGVAPTPAPDAGIAPVASAAPATAPLVGRVLDEYGKPLVGATVLLKGSSKGTSTDAAGNYTLEVPAGENTLLYGYGGYEDEVVRTHAGLTVNVTLTPRPDAPKRRR